MNEDVLHVVLAIHAGHGEETVAGWLVEGGGRVAHALLSRSFVRYHIRT